LDWQFVDLSSVEPEQDLPVCTGDANERERAVTLAYFASQIAAAGCPIAAARADANRIRDARDDGESGFTITIWFSDGSFGTYIRSDSAFGSGHMFHEIDTPECAG